ncbi:MAG: metallophosphoesterase [Planctomycetota bacterium]|nr:metallophosphoesterase [Planctomycetota bacterium]
MRSIQSNGRPLTTDHFLTLMMALVLGLLPGSCRSALAGDPVQTDRKGTRSLESPLEEAMWQFAIMGDRTGGPAEGIEILAQAVDEVNLVDPDLTLTVGDLIEGYNGRTQWLIQADQFHKTMNQLSCPWYPVAGNHDIYWRGPDRPDGEHESDYEKHFGPLWYWFEHKGSGFIILYTDEGHPETGKKNFGDPSCQTFSPRQLEWLDGVLEKTRALQNVFVFVHHPRWISGNYRGGHWDVVHQKLVDCGNVSAVFGGHIHRLHYGGNRDGIEYHALATTGGHRSRDFQGAGWIHHWNLVTVRPSGIDIAVVPVGSLLDPRQFTPERRTLTERLLKDDLVQFTSKVLIPAEPIEGVEVMLQMKNPVDRRLRFHLNSPDGRISFATPEVILAPLTRKSQVVRIHLDRLVLSGTVVSPLLEVSLEFDDESGRPVAVPARRVAIPFDHEQWTARRVGGGHLVLGGGEYVKVDSSRVPLAQGPFTVEGWVLSSDFSGPRPFITKTEQSEYGIFLTDGVASFWLHLDGQYHVAEGQGVQLQPDRWHHVTGQFDGSEIRIYLDGTLVGKKSAAGRRTLNKLPLIVGGNPNRKGHGTETLIGKIDGVRISSTARYGLDPFIPEVDPLVDEETLYQLSLDSTMVRLVQVERGSGLKPTVGQLVGGGKCQSGAAAFTGSRDR